MNGNSLTGYILGFRFGNKIEPLVNKDGLEIKTYLLPFKCPLDDRHDEYITKARRMYPEDVFGYYYRQDIVLKCNYISRSHLIVVIDLSNSDKYYTDDSFSYVNVTLQKLPLPGH